MNTQEKYESAIKEMKGINDSYNRINDEANKIIKTLALSLSEKIPILSSLRNNRNTIHFDFINKHFLVKTRVFEDEKLMFSNGEIVTYIISKSKLERLFAFRFSSCEDIRVDNTEIHIDHMHINYLSFLYSSLTKKKEQ